MATKALHSYKEHQKHETHSSLFFLQLAKKGLPFHPGLRAALGLAGSLQPPAIAGSDKTSSQVYANHSSACGGNTQLSCAQGTPPGLSLLDAR